LAFKSVGLPHDPACPSLKNNCPPLKFRTRRTARFYINTFPFVVLRLWLCPLLAQTTVFLRRHHRIPLPPRATPSHYINLSPFPTGFSLLQHFIPTFVFCPFCFFFRFFLDLCSPLAFLRLRPSSLSGPFFLFLKSSSSVAVPFRRSGPNLLSHPFAFRLLPPPTVVILIRFTVLVKRYSPSMWALLISLFLPFFRVLLPSISLSGTLPFDVIFFFHMFSKREIALRGSGNVPYVTSLLRAIHPPGPRALKGRSDETSPLLGRLMKRLAGFHSLIVPRILKGKESPRPLFFTYRTCGLGIAILPKASSLSPCGKFPVFWQEIFYWW